MNQPNWQQMIVFLLEGRRNTQTELQNKIGISQGNISKIKNGQKYEGITYKSAMALKNEYTKALKQELSENETD